MQLKVQKFLFTFILFLTISSLVQAETVDSGKALFDTYCQTCHGPNGDGNGPAAVDANCPVTDFQISEETPANDFKFVLPLVKDPNNVVTC